VQTDTKIEIKFYSSHIERNQRYRVIEEFDSKNESAMVRAYHANDCSEVRQMNPAYNNIFLGGNGVVILGEEKIEMVQGGRIFLPRDIWKCGNMKEMDEFIKKNPISEAKPGVLGLECLDEVEKESSRIHHFH